MNTPLPLCNKYIIQLLPTAPFNFDATLHKPDHFPSSDNDWEPGTRWQTMVWESIPLGLKFESQGDIHSPSISLSVFSASALDADFLSRLAHEIRYRLNLDLNLEYFYQTVRGHPLLGQALLRWEGMRPMHLNSLYEYIIITIVLQNATVRRSVSMLQTLFEHYGALLEYDGKELYAFWEPEAMQTVSEQELRALKVGYRAKSILRVSQAFIAGEIDEIALRQQSREIQRQTLLNLYGIGPASVGYLLADVFHNFDEMAHISPWEQKIYSKLFFDCNPESPAPVSELIAYFDQNFPGYRNLAVHYLWEDLFWQRKHEPVEWLENLIRL